MMQRTQQLNSQCARAGSAPQFCRAARLSRSCSVRSVASKDGYKVVIVGGGAAGATVASHYARKCPHDVAVIEPSETHYYQPLWTLVGGGFKDVEESARPQSQVLPKEVDWVKAAVSEFNPDENEVVTMDGRRIKYDYLVVATGMQAKWERVKGLVAALGDGKVVSNMSFGTAPKTFQALQNLKEGHALFTFPPGVVKCPGAGQKVCYISDDYLRRSGKRDKVKVTFASANEKIFGIPRYVPTINNIVKTRDINVQLNHHLVEVRGEEQEAVFNVLDAQRQPIDQVVMKYDMLHVTPPQGPLDVVAQSPLADADGWVAVDKETLQHRQYANVFGIGDCAAVPTSKTAAAAAAQFLVLRDNLDALMAGQSADVSRYDGYSSCPLVTKKGATMMMEFSGYDGSIMETFTPLGVDQSKEQFSMWLVKSEALPWCYWNLMTKGYVPWSEWKNFLKRFKTNAASSAVPAAKAAAAVAAAPPPPPPAAATAATSEPAPVAVPSRR